MPPSSGNRAWEQVFVDHYAWLRRWARQLTAGKREEGEDLAHELYIRLARSSSSPSGMSDDEIRAYLYRSLRNLFIRRSRRDAVEGSSVVDFASLEYRLSKRGRNDSIEAWSDLVGICEYVCIRRKSSRVAAVVILRFFLGYRPEEIMAILCMSRTAYDTSIGTGRLEIAAYLVRPHTLSFLDGPVRRHQLEWSLPTDEADILPKLRGYIFAEPEGACISFDRLAGCYEQPPKCRLVTQEIAHLVSCTTCLNVAAVALGLEPLVPQ